FSRPCCKFSKSGGTRRSPSTVTAFDRSAPPIRPWLRRNVTSPTATTSWSISISKRSVDPSKIAFVSLAPVANQAKPLRGVTPSRHIEVQCGGGGRLGPLANVRTPVGPTGAAHRYFDSLGLPRIYAPAQAELDRTAAVRTRMPGGVGGAAPRGAPPPPPPPPPATCGGGA